MSEGYQITFEGGPRDRETVEASEAKAWISLGGRPDGIYARSGTPVDGKVTYAWVYFQEAS